jgi:hypothetical protein
MKLSTFLVVKAIVSLLFGIGFAVIPTVAGSIIGIKLNADGLIMARFFAAVLIGIGLICWFTRNTDANSLKSIILSLCIADTVGFIVALCGQLARNMNSLGWIIVAIWFLLALGLGDLII